MPESQTGQKLFDFDVPIPRKIERFDGETFNRKRDGKALTTLQDRVEKLMLDHEWRTAEEMKQKLTNALEKPETASITARIRDLRKNRFGGYKVERRIREGTRAHEYRIPMRED